MSQFDVLTDIEFEDFVADLMSEDTGLEFVAGPRGGDKGIDCLAVTEDGERHVIQCKHFIRSPFSQLKSDAREAADQLAERDEPFASYRFVTSMELAHTQRDELVEILEPWVGSRDHVLGGKELAAKLGKHSDVAIRHTKLWFSGVAQLRRQLSADQYARRSALIDEIRPRLPRYVETRAFEEARRLVRENRVCIIDGPPGVGKTTLAQLLLIEGLEEGLEPFEIERGRLSKAWQLLDLQGGQIFYFDDFLGHISLSESRDEDHDLIRFIRRIAGDERRRLVLTTRDYIFTEARRKSDVLYREVDDAHLFFLTPERYTRLERAQIFYNHIHFSPQVDVEAKNRLVLRGRHLEVIDHPNYSPRLIEWITGFAGHRLRPGEKEDYGGFCLTVLNSPDDLWAEPFGELDGYRKALLLVFPGLRDRVEVGDLEAGFLASCESRGVEATKEQFEHALDGLAGTFVASAAPESFLSSAASEDPRAYTLLNPSLLDFLERHLVTSRTDTEAALRGAYFFEQVEWLWDAWRKDAEAPPEHLLPAFDEALSRLTGSPTTVPPWLFDEEGRPADNFHEQFSRRLETLLTWWEQPRLKDLFSAWLPAYARKWVDGVGKDGEREVYSHELKLFERLLEREVLDRRIGGEDMYGRVRSTEPCISRWKTIGLVKELCPEVLSAQEVATEMGALSDYIDRSLEDPYGFYEAEAFYGTEGLDELIEVAASWEITLDDKAVQSARFGLEDIQEQDDDENEAIEEMKREDARTGEEFAANALTEDDAPDGDDDRIEAMFWRLVDERWRPNGTPRSGDDS